jgi:hypothetical protein
MKVADVQSVNSESEKTKAKAIYLECMSAAQLIVCLIYSISSRCRNFISTHCDVACSHCKLVGLFSFNIRPLFTLGARWWRGQGETQSNMMRELVPCQIIIIKRGLRVKWCANLFPEEEEEFYLLTFENVLPAPEACVGYGLCARQRVAPKISKNKINEKMGSVLGSG